ncbi:MAG: hypothetical protein AB1568_09775 [Thermodesulfobacteriota bacterium]
MKLSLDRNVVEFTPESTQETTQLETLWRVLIDCAGTSKSLTPIGEFIPAKQNLARFTIEGIPGGRTVMSETLATEENTYICTICNKYSKVNAGETVPLCCGLVMEAVD